ncbi:MAG: ABC transporter permease [Myxococcales bacterium]
MLRQIRISARTLLRARSFSLTVVLTMALAIGASTAIFSVVRGVLLAPLPYPQPDRLVQFFNWYRPDMQASDDIAAIEYREDYSRLRSFSRVGTWASTGANLTTSSQPVHVTMGLGSASLLPTLGISPAVGRWFSADEETPGRDRVLVLSHELWRSKFGADPGAVGKTVTVDGNPYEIVGILPRGFELPDKLEVWAPLALPSDYYSETQRTSHFLLVVGRLAPKVSWEDARKELESASAALRAAHPEAYPASGHFLMLAKPLHDTMVGSVRATLWMLLCAVLLVLLMACANAGNLLLARSAARQRDLAVRAALGAGKTELVRETLVESLLLALTGGIAGIALAGWGIDLFLALGPELPRTAGIHLDFSVLGFAVAVTVASAAFFGVAPALSASRVDLQGALRTSSSTAAPHARRLRRVLVAAGVGLALVLLAGASLLLRSFEKVIHVDSGFQPQGAVTLRVALPDGKDADYRAFYSRALTTLRGLAGISAAGAIDILPLAGGRDRRFDIEGKPTPIGVQKVGAQIRTVMPGYFEAIGMRLLHGRAIEETDGPDSLPSVVVDEAFGKAFFAGDPIGHRIKIDFDDRLWTIVGVVNDVRGRSLDEAPGPSMYFAHAQRPAQEMTFVLRSPRAAGEVMRDALASLGNLDSRLPAFAVRTLPELVSASLAQRTFALALVQAFAVLALILAAIGLYGVLAYTVAGRTREIGVRMALGAPRGHVLGLVARESASVVGIGMAVGAVAAVAAARAIAGLLYGIAPVDPLSLAAAVLALSAVCAVATLLPARRALRIDPLLALKAE